MLKWKNYYSSRPGKAGKFEWGRETVENALRVPFFFFFLLLSFSPCRFFCAILKTFTENWVGSQNWLYWYWNLFNLGLEITIFRNKMFFKINSWNFQHLFDLEFYETSQNFSSFREPIEKIKIKVVCELKWAQILWGFTKF